MKVGSFLYPVMLRISPVSFHSTDSTEFGTWGSLLAVSTDLIQKRNVLLPALHAALHSCREMDKLKTLQKYAILLDIVRDANVQNTDLHSAV
jgi:hypothetical protein